jgi:hypothetical protein
MSPTFTINCETTPPIGARITDRLFCFEALPSPALACRTCASAVELIDHCVPIRQRSLECRLRLIHALGLKVRVDHREHIARFDRIALLHRERADALGHLGEDPNLFDPLQLTDELHFGDDGASGDRRGLDRAGGLLSGRSGGCFTTGLATGEK